MGVAYFGVCVCMNSLSNRANIDVDGNNGLYVCSRWSQARLLGWGTEIEIKKIDWIMI